MRPNEILIYKSPRAKAYRDVSRGSKLRFGQVATFPRGINADASPREHLSPISYGNVRGIREYPFSFFVTANIREKDLE